MKKYIAIALSIIIALSFGACAKNSNQNKTASKASVFYDRNGQKYSKEEDVKYYDASGNVYHKTMVEDFMPEFVNDKTGESYSGFMCYISEDGYLFYDPDNTLKRVKGSLNTYTDSSGKEYYDMSTITWDSSGNLTH